jgi:hypothetical protein
MLRDLAETSDEELRAELIEDGQDPNMLDRQIAEGLDSVVAEFMRHRVAATKAVRKATEMQAPQRRPTLARIRQLVQSAFERDPNLAAAYREGTKQSENDWTSVYDDLVVLGKIDPNAT